MLLIGYIIVGGILLAWYKLIFYRELYQKNILRRSLKVLVNNIKIIIKFAFYDNNLMFNVMLNIKLK